jgi:phospholipid/cholesterol/gamma-HCH transport system permease protein
MVIGLQGLAIFEMFGAQRLLPSLIAVAVLRELSPVLASVLVAAQAGSAYAAELGSMRIKEELDATEIMAVDSLRWHVVPRVLALMLACPILNTLGDVAGLAGGFTMSVLVQGEPAGVFLANLWTFVSVVDLGYGLLKTTVFGAIIGLVACYHGYFTTGGAAGVGRAVNDTVVRATLGFFAVNYILTSAMFG